MIRSEGEVVRDVDVLSDYPDAVWKRTPVVRWDGRTRQQSAKLAVFTVPNAVVTSCYIPIDVDRSRLFINQTYSEVTKFFNVRPVIEGDRYIFHRKIYRLPGRHVVIGGPIDGVWYHWLLNWAPRLTVLKALRPDIFHDPATCFLIDHRAVKEPFLSMLKALGVENPRVAWADHTVFDYQLDEAVLVSFLDETLHHPRVIRAFVEEVRRGLGVTLEAGQERRLYCSRQSLPAPKRRIDNFEAIEPVLEENGFDVVTLSDHAPAEQIKLFGEAAVVVSMHGADLANLMFCRPGARVLVFERRFSIDVGMYKMFSALACLCRLDYAILPVEGVGRPGLDYADFGNNHNQDCEVNPIALRRMLGHVLSPKRRSRLDWLRLSVPPTRRRQHPILGARALLSRLIERLKRRGAGHR